MPGPYTYHLQRAITGEWLDRDFTMAISAPPQRVLSGPGSLTGTCSPEPKFDLADDGLPILDDYSTLLYAELDGQIRWGGFLSHSAAVGDVCTMTWTGFSGYPKGLKMTETYPPTGQGVGLDVFDVTRALWSHVQGQESGNLGVVLDTQKAGVTIGTNEQPWGIVWWELSDVGDTIDQLAAATPFEYLEEHVWDDTVPGGVAHYLHLGYPGIGRIRNDLRFVQDENIAALVEPERLSDTFGNYGIGIGKGEGVTMVAVQVPRPDGRLRRTVVVTDKTVGDAALLSALVRRKLLLSGVDWNIPQIVVSDHPNAPIGALRPGDDILVEGDLPYLGDFALWHRITGLSLNGDGTATMSLLRAEAL
jgi:hypothetical protein